jgi:hypothetical protein
MGFFGWHARYRSDGHYITKVWSQHYHSQTSVSLQSLMKGDPFVNTVSTVSQVWTTIWPRDSDSRPLDRSIRTPAVSSSIGREGLPVKQDLVARKMRSKKVKW